ncbi:hypothetical protein BAPAT_1523 [Bacillus anthracis str. SVA11]|nr:hypothetical protein BAPAT_1523 [Bacillus anthracis str. SVA11]
MFKTKKQLLFNPHDALMKEQFYTVYHELKKQENKYSQLFQRRIEALLLSL